MRFNPVNLVLLLFQPYAQVLLEILNIELLLLLLLLQDQSLRGVHDIIRNVLYGPNRTTSALGFIFIKWERFLLFRQQTKKKKRFKRREYERFSFVRDKMMLDKGQSSEKL